MSKTSISTYSLHIIADPTLGSCCLGRFNWRPSKHLFVGMIGPCWILGTQSKRLNMASVTAMSSHPCQLAHLHAPHELRMRTAGHPSQCWGFWPAPGCSSPPCWNLRAGDSPNIWLVILLRAGTLLDRLLPPTTPTCRHHREGFFCYW